MAGRIADDNCRSGFGLVNPRKPPEMPHSPRSMDPLRSAPPAASPTRTCHHVEDLPMIQPRLELSYEVSTTEPARIAPRRHLLDCFGGKIID
jgi:hypothetical protein